MCQMAIKPPKGKSSLISFKHNINKSKGYMLNEH